MMEIFNGGSNTLTPEVGSAGTYELMVTDSRNGCTATDVVVIPLNEDFPSNAILDIKAPSLRR